MHGITWPASPASASPACASSRATRPPHSPNSGVRWPCSAGGHDHADVGPACAAVADSLPGAVSTVRATLADVPTTVTATLDPRGARVTRRAAAGRARRALHRCAAGATVAAALARRQRPREHAGELLIAGCEHAAGREAAARAASRAPTNSSPHSYVAAAARG